MQFVAVLFSCIESCLWHLKAQPHGRKMTHSASVGVVRQHSINVPERASNHTRPAKARQPLRQCVLLDMFVGTLPSSSSYSNFLGLADGSVPTKTCYRKASFTQWECTW